MELSSIWSIILSMVSESGVWAMLFLALLLVLIKSFNKREEIYQNLIKMLGKSLNKVDEIKEDIEDLKFVSGIGGNSKLNKNTSTNSTENLSKEDAIIDSKIKN